MLHRFTLALVFAAAGWAAIIPDVRAAIAKNDFARGESLIAAYRAEHGVTPEMVEALSWLGRGALAAKQFDKAETYARQTQSLVMEQLKQRALDAEPHLPLALGAAIEVQAQVLNERGERNEAIALLRKELAVYRSTSIHARIQKNINLIALEGKPAPDLDEHEFLGSKPAALATLKGKPVILFFWAHWCGDCKQQGPVLVQLEKEYATKGLIVVAPTQRYGYVGRGQEAGPAEELKYIDEIRHKFYPDLLDAATPVSEANFKNYGASTTPTLVLIDRQGIVRLYHPGQMTLEQLRAVLNRLG